MFSPTSCLASVMLMAIYKMDEEEVAQLGLTKSSPAIYFLSKHTKLVLLCTCKQMCGPHLEALGFPLAVLDVSFQFGSVGV